MLLNSELASQHVIESEHSKRAQAGIDLSAKKIELIKDGGIVLKDKTILDSKNYVTVSTIDKHNTKGWFLEKGIYSVTFNEGIKIPNNLQAKVTHRSSIYRMGNEIESPWWDAGFECTNMNSTLIVNNPLFIEENARLAQVVFYEMHTTNNTYNGQWQGLDSAYKQ